MKEIPMLIEEILTSKNRPRDHFSKIFLFFPLIQKRKMKGNFASSSFLSIFSWQFVWKPWVMLLQRRMSLGNMNVSIFINETPDSKKNENRKPLWFLKDPFLFAILKTIWIRKTLIIYSIIPQGFLLVKWSTRFSMLLYTILPFSLLNQNKIPLSKI